MIMIFFIIKGVLSSCSYYIITIYGPLSREVISQGDAVRCAAKSGVGRHQNLIHCISYHFSKKSLKIHGVLKSLFEIFLIC